MANLILVANWLQEKGVIDWAKYVHREYLTGTAITIIVVLLILLVAPRGERPQAPAKVPGLRPCRHRQGKLLCPMRQQAGVNFTGLLRRRMTCFKDGPRSLPPIPLSLGQVQLKCN